MLYSFFTIAFIVIFQASTCLSSLEPRQSGRMGQWRYTNNNTWLLDSVHFTHQTPGPPTEETEAQPDGAVNASPRSRGAEFYLRRSRLIRDNGNATWVHLSPESRILCTYNFENPRAENEWAHCMLFDIGPPGDTMLNPDLKSRLKWRLLDLVTSQDGRSFRKATIEIVNSLPPARHTINDTGGKELYPTIIVYSAKFTITAETAKCEFNPVMGGIEDCFMKPEPSKCSPEQDGCHLSALVTEKKLQVPEFEERYWKVDEKTIPPRFC